MTVDSSGTTAGFLPTPSARRATLSRAQLARQIAISTHALREEGDINVLANQLAMFISTHALREEGDDGGRDTPWVYQDISTHALREEGDSKCAGK